ncbi:MAG: hypothetical protein J7518_11070 [Nocardioidaceae bacterium]|nr:hypothetical protein [Nocardioidaceae bacterium]
MGIGLSIVLIAAGLIFALDVVDLPSSWDAHVDSNTLGWILVAVGALGLIMALILTAQHRRTVVHSGGVEYRDVPPE